MKHVILSVPDNKFSFLMELIRNFSFVKAKPLTDSNKQFLTELEGAVNELNLVKQGKAKLHSAKKVLNEL